MACTGANGLDCNDFGLVVPCGPEPTLGEGYDKLEYASPVIVDADGAYLSWYVTTPNEDMFIETLIMAKNSHYLYAYNRETYVPAGITEVFIPFDVEEAVVYKVFSRLRFVTSNVVGPWRVDNVFYTGADFTYLVEDENAATEDITYMVMDDYDSIYLVSENIPGPSKWAYNPDGSIMLDPDGYPVEKQ